MRLIVFVSSLFLIVSCVNQSRVAIKDQPGLHCPGFNTKSWTKTEIPKSQQTMLINKQEFAVPDGYQTLWFKTRSNSVGLCIIPDKQNRGVGYGCSSAYAIYTENKDGWYLNDQKVAICSN